MGTNIREFFGIRNSEGGLEKAWLMNETRGSALRSEEVADAGGGEFEDDVDGVGAEAADVGGDEAVVVLLGVLPDAAGLDGGLALKDVGAVAAEVAAFEGLEEGVFIADGPPGGIDEDGAGADEGELARADEAAGFIAEVDVDGDSVGVLQEGIEVGALDGGGPFGLGQVGVVTDDSHAEGGGVAGHPLADAAAADEAEGAALEQHAGELFTVPEAGLDMAIGSAQMAGAGHEEHPAELGGGGELIEHLLLAFEGEQGDAACGEGLGVDVIGAGGGGGDELQMHGGVQLCLTQGDLHGGIENGMHLGEQGQHGGRGGLRGEDLPACAEGGGDGGGAGGGTEIEGGEDGGHV